MSVTLVHVFLMHVFPLCVSCVEFMPMKFKKILPSNMSADELDEMIVGCVAVLLKQKAPGCRKFLLRSRSAQSFFLLCSEDQGHLPFNRHREIV